MADDSDEDRPKRIVENQPYDETLEVPDGEDVASIYTPTPRHPRNQPPNLHSQQHYPQQSNRLLQPQPSARPTPPPTSSSSGSINDINQRYQGGRSNKMSESPDLTEPKVSEQKMYYSGGKPGGGGMDGGDSASEGNESDDDVQYNYNDQHGGYDPAVYRDLPVSPDIKDIFKYIERYQPQNIELDFKLRPFIPDYIPSIGDIDAFIKVPRPDGKDEMLGLVVVDEPSSNQSDPHVLDLFFRTLSKQSGVENVQPTAVKSVENNNTKAIDSWIRNISALQKNKPIQTVNYQKPMPSIDSLMREWPPEFEELLKEVSLPSPELDVDLNTYADILCALLDIPVYKSRVQSIHALLNLFSEFKNSEHFKNNRGGFDMGKGGGGDRLVID